MSEAAKSRKRKSISLEKKRTRWGYAFALPFAIGFVLFFLSPLILYFILGFSKLSLTGEGMQLLPVGLDNFRQVLFVQVGYFDSVLKSLGELLLTSPAIVLYSFFVATLLNQKFRGRGLARAIFFLPVIMASGIAAVSNNDSLMKYAIHAVSGEVSLSGNEDKTSMVKGLMELLGITGNKTANVALIQNARSHKADCGRKDIIKVEGDASWLNLDVLAYLDPDISVTVIENGKAVRKEKPKPPKRLVNIVRCRNPRCISSIEEECDQIFEMSSNGKYRCIYCEQELQVKPE